MTTYLGPYACGSVERVQPVNDALIPLTITHAVRRGRNRRMASYAGGSDRRLSAPWVTRQPSFAPGEPRREEDHADEHILPGCGRSSAPARSRSSWRSIRPAQVRVVNPARPAFRINQLITRGRVSGWGWIRLSSQSGGEERRGVWSEHTGVRGIRSTRPRKGDAEVAAVAANGVVHVPDPRLNAVRAEQILAVAVLAIHQLNAVCASFVVLPEANWYTPNHGQAYSCRSTRSPTDKPSDPVCEVE